MYGFITARIRRMTEGNVFTLSTIVGGTPFPGPGGGTPFSGPGGGYPLPRSRLGVPLFQVQAGGIPLPRSRGYPLPGKGVPPTWEGSTSPPGKRVPHLGRGTPLHGKGVPPSRGVPSIQVRSQDGGTPYWSSIVCTCYAAGGVLLAFTQEDFLVAKAYVSEIGFSQFTQNGCLGLVH